MKKMGLAVVVLLLATIALLSGASGGLSAQTRPDFVVTKTVDTNDGRCDSDCSLREAIIAANSTPGNQWVHVKSGTYTLAIAGPVEDFSRTGDLDITDDITLSGDGPGKTIIDGGGIDRVLDVSFGNSAVIRGMTLRNGLMTSAPGGALLNEGNVVLFRVTVSGSSANNGGGLANEGTMTLLESIIERNSAGPDGFGGGIANWGQIKVYNSRVEGNGADDSSSGGIWNTGSLDLHHTRVVNNWAENGAGGMHNLGQASLLYSEVSGNHADYGGGISNEGYLLLFKTRVVNNRSLVEGPANLSGPVFASDSIY